MRERPVFAGRPNALREKKGGKYAPLPQFTRPPPPCHLSIGIEKSWAIIHGRIAILGGALKRDLSTELHI